MTFTIKKKNTGNDFTVNMHWKVFFAHNLDVKQDSRTGPFQVIPLRASVDLGAKAYRGYSSFPKGPALLGPHHQFVQCHK